MAVKVIGCAPAGAVKVSLGLGLGLVLGLKNWLFYHANCSTAQQRPLIINLSSHSKQPPSLFKKNKTSRIQCGIHVEL